MHLLAQPPGSEVIYCVISHYYSVDLPYESISDDIYSENGFSDVSESSVSGSSSSSSSSSPSSSRMASVTLYHAYYWMVVFQPRKLAKRPLNAGPQVF